MSAKANCCCRFGAAVGGEWPEFRCPDCVYHTEDLLTHNRCRKHQRARNERHADLIRTIREEATRRRGEGERLLEQAQDLEERASRYEAAGPSDS